MYHLMTKPHHLPGETEAVQQAERPIFESGEFKNPYA